MEKRNAVSAGLAGRGLIAKHLFLSVLRDVLFAIELLPGARP
jgi:hypothetical protein